MNFDYAKVIGDAFTEWSRYGDIEFQQIQDQGGAAGVGTVADIRIYFGDIPGGTAGYAYYPSSWGSAIAGDILLDTLDRFNTDQLLFESIVLHEIGHALGLGHVDDNSIMTSTVRKIGLQQDDIDGIQAIYGVQDDVIPTNGSSNNDTNTDTTNDTAPSTQNGDDQANKLVGTSGNDTISGGGGKDTLKGGEGDDLLNGQGDNDILVGYYGDDTLNGGSGADKLKGGAGVDDLNGGTGKDLLRAGGGNDLLDGGADNDKLVGGGGNDLLDGGADDDRLVGGRGSDTMIGGTGNDKMSGRSSADVFLFRDGHGDDVITDFNANNANEKIDLSGLSGFNSFSDIQFAATQTGTDVLIDTGANSSILLWDVNLAALDNSDFLF